MGVFFLAIQRTTQQKHQSTRGGGGIDGATAETVDQAAGFTNQKETREKVFCGKESMLRGEALLPRPPTACVAAAETKRNAMCCGGRFFSKWWGQRVETPAARRQNFLALASRLAVCVSVSVRVLWERASVRACLHVCRQGGTGIARAAARATNREA